MGVWGIVVMSCRVVMVVAGIVAAIAAVAAVAVAGDAVVVATELDDQGGDDVELQRRQSPKGIGYENTIKMKGAVLCQKEMELDLREWEQ